MVKKLIRQLLDISSMLDAIASQAICIIHRLGYATKRTRKVERHLKYLKAAFIKFLLPLGPCKGDEILVLASNARIPECVRNSCDNGRVRFNENCYPLHSDEGCKKFTAFIGRKVLLVPNPTTASLVCADEDFFYECVKNCCVGSKREYRNICESSTEINREPSRQTRSVGALSKLLGSNA